MSRFELSNHDRVETSVRSDLHERTQMLSELVALRIGESVSIEWVIDQAVEGYLESAIAKFVSALPE